VAYQRNRLARCVDRLDQRNGILVLLQIPQWPVPARIKDSVKVLRIHIGQLQRIRQLVPCRHVLFEAFGIRLSGYLFDATKPNLLWFYKFCKRNRLNLNCLLR